MQRTAAAAVSTTDVDEARVEVTNIFCPHRLVPRGREDVRLDLRVRRLGDVGLVHLDYGVPVRIDPAPLRTFYLVQLPLAGRAHISHGGERIVSSPGRASVLSPDAPTSMLWGARNPQSIVYISRTAVQRQLGRLLGRPVTAPVHFQLGMETGDDRVQAWHRSVRFVYEELCEGNPLVDGRRLAALLEELVVCQLLVAQPHTASAELVGAVAAPSRTVRAAADLIADHHAEPLTVADVAEAVGVSVRSLQIGFRRELDTTPTAYLRARRLAGAHDDLCAASPTTRSVTDIALDHGFLHLGRFSVDYRRTYGESPSRTLAR